MESRYTNRFSTLGQVSAKQISNNDSAGNLTERLTHAKGSISAQQDNIRELFSTAQEMIAGINTRQSMIGETLVKNIPLPTESIKNSPSSQLGYVQLSMRFLQSGLLHFIEQMSEAQHRIQNLEKTIEKLADYDSEVEIIGQMRAIDIEALEAESNDAARIPSSTLSSSSDTSTPSVTSPLQSTADRVDSPTQDKPVAKTSSPPKKVEMKPQAGRIPSRK
nr:hypothetical protein [Plasmopara viticola lesion associated mononegaambi virus 5]